MKSTQLLPQKPQLKSSESRSTQSPLQLVRPTAQEGAQVPKWHPPEAQTLPQAPQLAESESKWTQTPPHSVKPPEQDVVSPGQEPPDGPTSVHRLLIVTPSKQQRAPAQHWVSSPQDKPGPRQDAASPGQTPPVAATSVHRVLRETPSKQQRAPEQHWASASHVKPGPRQIGSTGAAASFVTGSVP